jgi:tetratricopeptide (TPR) repeat protein
MEKSKMKSNVATTSKTRAGGWLSRPGLLLAGLVLAAFLPSLGGEFIWDDDANIIRNGPLRTLDGLRRIWFEPGATQMYYPLTHTSFWLDYQFWGGHTAPYHLENVLLHLVSALLLWQGLRLLRVKGAWLAAALFAVHPVQVESVAWITERKNTLSGVFFMGALLAAVRFWGLDRGGAGCSRPREEADAMAPPAGPLPQVGGFSQPAWRFYWLCLGLYLLGMLSKTAIIGLPVIVLLLVWWKQGRVRLRDVALTAPFFLVASWLVFFTFLIETKNGARGEPFGFSLVERGLIAARGFWFYLGKLAWPHPLIFVYPRWKIDAASLAAYLPVAALAAVGVVLWAKRAGWGRLVLVALGFFVVMWLPISGFFNVVYFYYSFVSDHFQYLALIGPVTLAAAGLVTLVELWPGWQKASFLAAGALLVVLAGLAAWQTRIYRNSEALWLDTLARNPNCWMAHGNLGGVYSRQDRFDQAATEYREELRLKPDDFMAYNNLGLDAARQGRLEEAIWHYGQALLLNSNYYMAHYNLGNALARQGKFERAIGEFDRTLALRPDFGAAFYGRGTACSGLGDTNAAFHDWQETLRLQPGFTPAQVNIARVLAAQGKLDEAIEQYRQVLAGNPNSVDALANLGNALLAKGRLQEAIGCYQAAAQLDPDSPVIHYNLGVALTRQGKQSEAREQLRLAADLNARRRAEASAAPQNP